MWVHPQVFEQQCVFTCVWKRLFQSTGSADEFLILLVFLQNEVPNPVGLPGHPINAATFHHKNTILGHARRTQKTPLEENWLLPSGLLPVPFWYPSGTPAGEFPFHLQNKTTWTDRWQDLDRHTKRKTWF